MNIERIKEIHDRMWQLKQSYTEREILDDLIKAVLSEPQEQVTEHTVKPLCPKGVKFCVGNVCDKYSDTDASCAILKQETPDTVTSNIMSMWDSLKWTIENLPGADKARESILNIMHQYETGERPCKACDTVTSYDDTVMNIDYKQKWNELFDAVVSGLYNPNEPFNRSTVLREMKRLEGDTVTSEEE